MNSKNNLKDFYLRASMDSDTSGYSSSSLSSHRSNGSACGSFFNDHNYTSIRAPTDPPLFEQIKRKGSLTVLNNEYNDHIVTLKESAEQTSSIDAEASSLKNLHANGGEVSRNVEPEKTYKFTPIMTRRKSIALEREEMAANAPRRSRRLSTYIETKREESPKFKITARKKSTADKEILQFPKLSSVDSVVELKSSPPSSSSRATKLKSRRKSHGGFDNVTPVTPIDRKIINRRQSVYVAHNNSIRPRRPSTFVEEVKPEPVKKSRRKSISKENVNRNRVRKGVEPPAKRLKEQETSEGLNEIEEDIIEDVWFVSLVTIDRESQMRFLIKWDGHPPIKNTYEPLEHIRHCEVLQEYVDRKFIQHAEQIEIVRKSLLSDIEDKFNSFLNRSKASIVNRFCDFDELEFKCSLLAYIFTYGGEVLAPFMKKLRYSNLIYHFYAQWKKEQDSNFILLETIMSEENYSFELTAENNIDYEPIPSFKYLAKVDYPITSYNFGLNVGCKCGSTCNRHSNCCPQNLGWNFMYNEADGKLNSKIVQMIVECNDFCGCNKNCPNRPKEISVKLVIFKTYERGWSVKTLDHIPAGKFIVEYTGEFLDANESKKRARAYHTSKDTYLFDLDYIDKGTPYSIDATQKGNIARFINHSCNPNLSTWPATTCNRDPRMHKLYYFSQRYIRPGEEL